MKPAKHKKERFIRKDFFVILLSVCILIPLTHLITAYTPVEKKIKAPLRKKTSEIKIKREYGLNVDSFHIEKKIIERGENLSSILQRYNISREHIHKLAGKAKDVFDLRKIRSNQEYAVFLSKDSLQIPQYFVYQESPVSYVRFSLFDTLKVAKYQKATFTQNQTVSAEIKLCLWNAIVDKNLDPKVAIMLSEIYAWTVNFFDLKQGDKFKFIYEELRLAEDSSLLDIKDIKAAVFYHKGKKHYAIPFQQDTVLEFFNQAGKSIKRGFLKAPLKYAYISSGYSNSRFHPVLKYYRAHHGIDYAAPAGTPVNSIGNGTVVFAAYTRQGGNVVKIQHTNNIVSGYLHLSRFGKGIRQGAHVYQGDIIGYVGSTGLSTGPHLDFRIWQNGKAVNPTHVKSPPGEPVQQIHWERFCKTRDSVIAILQKVPF